MQYLTETRLKAAAGLLRTTDMSVCDISMEVGYQNVSAFNRTFKKRYGKTPVSYRQTWYLEAIEPVKQQYGNDLDEIEFCGIESATIVSYIKNKIWIWAGKEHWIVKNIANTDFFVH